MDSPLVISFIIFIAAVGVGLWSQHCLPRLSDSRNMLFIICFFLGLGSAASCLFHLLYLLLVGQRAQGDIAAFGYAYYDSCIVEAAELCHRQGG